MALRTTQNVLTHIKLSGDGQAHTANQIAFDNDDVDVEGSNLQAVIAELVDRIDALEAASGGSEA
jgi:hypothetical protein